MEDLVFSSSSENPNSDKRQIIWFLPVYWQESTGSLILIRSSSYQFDLFRSTFQTNDVDLNFQYF